VASQKVVLSALGKRRMQNVDKKIDKNNKQLFVFFHATQSTLTSIFMALQYDACSDPKSFLVALIDVHSHTHTLEKVLRKQKCLENTP
jgi:hypothetical protein